MRILLVGEYSRLHNSLKEGLEYLGHDVTIIATGDYFKDYPSDIKLQRRYDSGIGKKIKVGLYKLTGIDLTSISLKKQFFTHRDLLKGFDIVQLINECSFGASPEVEKQFISFLKKHNKKLFLLSCGADYISISHALNENIPYSILDGYLKLTVPKNEFEFALKYVSKPFIEHHKYLFKTINGVIASDLDYHIPLKGHPKYLGLIPNPVNTDMIKFIDLKIEDRIIIFLGINRSNYHTKGVVYFEKALEIIQEKYFDLVHIEIVENLPYKDYINKYNEAHIVLDQVLSYDQGYNALEAMAKGKAVFTGAEKEFNDYYNLTYQVAINVIPDVQYIVQSLEKLISNPDLITEIGKNASQFVRDKHHFVKIAKKYLETWNIN